MIPTQDSYIFNVPILGILQVKIMYHIPFQLEKNDGIIRNLSIAGCVFWRWQKKKKEQLSMLTSNTHVNCLTASAVP